MRAYFFNRLFSIFDWVRVALVIRTLPALIECESFDTILSHEEICST